MSPENKKSMTTYRVIYGDTDQMGVVYYGNYLRWFEMGRTQFLREAGIPYTEIEAAGLHFPVTEVLCHYVKSARYDDELVIETTLSSQRRATLSFVYRVMRAKDNCLLATGSTKHACVDSSGHVQRIPANIVAALRPFLTNRDDG